MAAKWCMIKKWIPNNLYKKPDWVSKWVIWACTEATEGFGFGVETFIRKFCYLSDGGFIPIYEVVLEIHKNRPRWVHTPSVFEGLNYHKVLRARQVDFHGGFGHKLWSQHSIIRLKQYYPYNRNLNLQMTCYVVFRMYRQHKFPVPIIARWSQTWPQNTSNGNVIKTTAAQNSFLKYHPQLKNQEWTFDILVMRICYLE